MACKCKNIDIGSYKNQVTLINWWNGNYVCVDKCLMDEILELWDEQIQTTGCCCGHNKAIPYINTLETDFEKMIELGYRWWKNEYGVICYEPKSVGKQLESENGKLPIPHVSKRCDIEQINFGDPDYDVAPSLFEDL